MQEQDSGLPAVESPQDDYVLHSETKEVAEPPKVEPEAEAEEKPEAPPQEGEPKKKGGFQKKIDRLSQTIEQERQEKAFLMSELERMRSGTKEAPQTGEPNPEDFPTFIDYNKAFAKWQAQETAQAVTKEFFESREKQAQEAKVAQEYQAKEADYSVRADALLETVPDFYERAAELYQHNLVTPAIEAAVVDSPIGEKITLHFINNPQELAAFKNMDVVQTYRAIGKLEAKLENSEIAVRTTRAPPPISPVRSSSNGGTKDPDKMSFEEYNKWRSKGGG